MLSAVAALPARRRSHGGGNAATLARFDARPLRQKACRKADPEAKPIAVSYSSVRVLADASEITGLPRDTFEVWEISKSEYEEFRPQ
jgi:hypothetical protein